MVKRAIYLLILLAIAVTIPKTTNAQENVSINIDGHIYGPDGKPLQNASILLWGFYLEGETSSDNNGHFELTATTTETSCQLYVIWDAIAMPMDIRTTVALNN